MTPPCSISITTAPLELDGAYRALDDPTTGAALVFAGRVRDRNTGRPVRGIRYATYAAMAHAEGERIWAEAAARWPVRRGVIWHRIGDLAVGEASVLIGVATAHRAEAFAACQFCLDALKERAPIWKEETYTTGDVQWIDDLRSSWPAAPVGDSAGTSSC